MCRWLVFVVTTYRNLNIVDAVMHKLDSLADDLEMQIFERTRELEEERMKSELLLYSMMPEWVSFVNSSLSCLVLTIDNPHAYIIYTFAHIF